MSYPSDARFAPRHATRAYRRLFVSVRSAVVLVAICVQYACNRQPESKAVAVQTYTVRGEIIQLPDPSRPATELQIRHEAIPTFVDQSGAATGMRQMIMPFPTGPGVSLAGLSPGDKVEFVFEVRWGGSPLYQVTRISPLPDSIRLEWETEAPRADPEAPEGRR